jgi:drug/metabolite transporter (DMT)-like permease
VGPVIGIAASALALGERPTLSDYIGCALILTAAACVLIVPSTRKPASVKANVR